jgi:hypothetical protein
MKLRKPIITLLICAAIFAAALFLGHQNASATHTRATSHTSSISGHVYWANGAGAPGATVFINSSCGNLTTHSTTGGFFPNDGGGVILTDYCTYRIYASTSGCTVWYTDTVQFFTNQQAYFANLYLIHSVRVCGQPAAQ